MNSNRLVLSGEVTEVAALRYTPAGVPLLAFTLRHMSQQTEAGMSRQVVCEIPVIAMADLAESAQNLRVGQSLRVVGFLAKKSANSRQLVVHSNVLEIIEKG